MLIDFKRGQGSIVLRIKILDSSVSTGAGKTGLTHASSGLKVSTIADNEATATAYTVAASNLETITTLGTYAAPTSGKARFKEVDATNHPGVYEIHIADARFAVTNAKSVLVSVSGATNAAETDALVPLRDVNPYDAVRMGMTALPNAAAEASGGLPTLSAAQASNGTINANVHRWLTGTPNALQSGRVDSYLGAVASAVIAAGSFAANALDAVWSTATRVLTAGTNIALAKGTGVTGFTDLSAADVRTAVGLASANLDTQLGSLATGSNLAVVAGYLDTEIAAIKAKTDNLPASPAATSDIPSAATIADAVWDEATSGHQTAGTTGKALTDAGAAGTPPTVGQIADAVWDEAQSGHTTAGTFGKFLDAAVSGVSTGGLSAADIADAVLDEAMAGHTTPGTLGQAVADILVDTGTTLQGELDGIQADTEDIQSRLPAALVSGRIDASVGAMAADVVTASALAASAVSEIQSGLSTLDAAGIRTALGLASANVDTQLAAINALATAIQGYVDTEVAAIKAKTDALPSDPADASDIAASFSSLASTLSTIAGYLDTEVAAIKSQTDKLTFDGSNNVAANVEAINAVALTGAGTSVSPWGPA